MELMEGTRSRRQKIVIGCVLDLFEFGWTKYS